MSRERFGRGERFGFGVVLCVCACVRVIEFGGEEWVVDLMMKEVHG